jgi:hypothetical protein
VVLVEKLIAKPRDVLKFVQRIKLEAELLEDVEVDDLVDQESLVNLAKCLQLKPMLMEDMVCIVIIDHHLEEVSEEV